MGRRLGPQRPESTDPGPEARQSFITADRSPQPCPSRNPGWIILPSPPLRQRSLRPREAVLRDSPCRLALSPNSTRFPPSTQFPLRFPKQRLNHLYRSSLGKAWRPDSGLPESPSPAHCSLSIYGNVWIGASSAGCPAFPGQDLGSPGLRPGVLEGSPRGEGPGVGED